ncbi:IS3 family transposase [Pseudomonas sp. LD120]|uniref:IS3 family transposase n=1 Tax=Pseudomonas sp. LD120 TaxID=485751 RepID=UPI00135A79F2|nr:IS3 family transposase [Pseudomonas sp. LD120]KAF0861761.1 IS3 family transposase [Pseudomonas sp. LD120]KAF0862169.1 IS3 family transposase [Pseudomonas sp. LD120]KAF0863773.1 IS3 family transposase [Pseudomonas sp. LD120]KAF0865352.1 IS3 family transposase [Pseudomonas sp. LD120]KAF0867286.1 IS3 family transposase [Pseudomonas sp. LD120]
MSTEIKRTQSDYTLAFKLAVVDQVEKGELSYKEAQQRYGIQGRSTVLVWLRKHGLQDWSQGASIRSSRTISVNEPALPLTPEQRIKELEAQLALSNQKAQFLEAVVNVLKNDYGISVVKKRPRQVLTQKQIQDLSISRACQFMGISRQAYYKRNQAQDARLTLDQRVMDFVQYKRLHQPRLGTRKLHHLLHCQPLLELQVGRDRLFAILREHRLLVARKRAYHKTTDSHHRFRRHPNLLKSGPDQVVPNGPEQVWVADITYLPTREGVAYLSLVTDAYSRKIVGYHVHENLRTESVIRALRSAVKQRQTELPLVHHSDRGSQYCSALYQALHAKHGIRCSMTDGYDCYQNALAERVNGILKTEFLFHRPENLAHARKMVSESVSIYNAERPHLALKYKTPDAVHRAF